MKTRPVVSLPVAAALAGALAISVPASAVAQQTAPSGQATAVSIIAGHNVVDAVDDVRGSVVEVIDSLLEAGTELNIANWDERKIKLKLMREELEEMEQVLDQKAEATDASWLSWLGDDDYGVTVTQQIRALGMHLKEISAMLGGSWDTRTMEIIVGQNVLDQLEDLRETTDDLLNALEDVGPEYGWTYDPQEFEKARLALARLEQNLNRKREGGDAELRMLLKEQEYHVFAYENVDTLATILLNLLQPKQGE